MTSLGLRLGLVREKILQVIASIAIQDTFTDTNGTLITAHTPDIDSVGGGWSYEAFSGSFPGTPTIESNALTSPSTAVGYNTIDSGINEHKITAKLTQNVTSGGAVSVLTRYQDSSNFWQVQLNDGGSRVLIKESIAGADFERAFSAFSITLGVAYDFDVDTNVSPTSQIVVNSPVSLSYDSSTKEAQTHVGFLTGKSAVCDDLVVQ